MKERKMTPVKLLSLGYFITIAIGTILLMCPFSSNSGEWTNFVDSLFTATSATCVTGLVPFDTATHWSFVGQIVILCLIQIGGLGFMTIITLLFMLVRKNIGLYNRTVLMQSAGSYNISEVTKLMKIIIVGTILFEGIGALVLYTEFIKIFPENQAIYASIFHSISAFCNAGFDIMGTGASLTQFSSNWVVLGTIMVLIVLGGSGFIVWADLLESRFKFSKFKLHTKIVLVFTAVLIIVPAGLFFLMEFTRFGQHGAFESMSLSDKILNSLFLAVNPRTAGFNSVDLTKMTSSGKFLYTALMMIGGNSGSTAGGIKVTTFIVVVANLVSSARNKPNVVLFKRRVPNSIIKQASSLFLAYLLITCVATFLIAIVEPNFQFGDVLFEATSAIGTVGSSLGLSAQGTLFTKLILTGLMYTGRLGALTLFSLFMKENSRENLVEPKGKLLVG